MQQDEIYSTRLDALRAAIIQGEESGDALLCILHTRLLATRFYCKI
ncbi:MAG TPA: hypothetical protein ENI98_00775 [Gammaproteobacteria bacterium]|nr:hypothetical protein [Gammaproteobacteria bacterium]